MTPEPGRLDRLLDAVASAVMALAGAMMVVLILIFSWLVYGRYVLNATPTWVEQVSLLLVVWIAFLGAAVGIRRQSHLAVDFIRDALPAPLRMACVVFTIVTLGLFGAIMAWQGYVMWERTVQREIPLLGISEGWRAIPVSLSGVLTAVFCLDELRRLLTGRKGV
ncbi:TRAP transporter small permease [Jannaschia pohangensis]|uniref:TRAP transporter small permease protein n=1 Tax=Jannaschia pohangensis TaxID=390807 RepID=A0A1I3HGN5_9RHOB|nr:TRAP transporter small permease [Jannaschia pohangensis]SFI34915.1 TRAP-type C4-dicarboxylate transport system, small permease component [Jannaschia pohangensis]